MHPYKEAWWETYRKRQYRRERLNLEMIVRKSLVDTVKEYVSHCSIAGVKQICEVNIGYMYRMIWIAIFCVMVGATCNFLFYMWMDTLTKPLIVTIESATYPIDQIDFPAVAICNINRISKKALAEFAKMVYPILAKRNESLELVEYFCLQMGRLLDYSWTEFLRNHPFLDELDRQRFDKHNIPARMKSLSPSCEEMLVKCAWAGVMVDCMSIFAVRRTVRGHCCAFNYILDYDSAGTPNKTIAHVKRQTSAGYLKGLNVFLDPQLDDYSYPLSNLQGFDVFLFDPTHFADPSGGRVIHRVMEPNQVMLLEMQSVKQVATDEVRKYPLSTRKCLFHDEKQSLFGDMYSYSACIVRCRIKTVQSLCKCTPYFLPIGNSGESICTLEDLYCLNKHKEKLLYLYPQNVENTVGLELEMQDSLFCPDCLPDCEFTQHFTKAFKTPIAIASVYPEYAAKGMVTPFNNTAFYCLWKGSCQLEAFANKSAFARVNFDSAPKRRLLCSYLKRSKVNLTDKCMLSIFQSTSDGVLDRLDVISYWFEVLSNVGGFAGILLGLSIISSIELIYFFLIRFPILLYENYKKYH